jgi:hypothetical protein
MKAILFQDFCLNKCLSHNKDERKVFSSFVKVAYEAQMFVGKAKHDYRKLKAITSIESSGHELTAE